VGELDVSDTTLTGPGSGWMARTTRMVTVNGDEKSGSVVALLNIDSNTSGTVHVTGNWMCNTL